MPHSRCIQILLMFILLTANSSCALPSSSVLPTSTQTSAASRSPTNTIIQTIEPTLAATPTLEATATVTPTGSGPYLPVGLAAVSPMGSSVDYYDLQGQLLGELTAPDIGTGTLQQAHIAGPLTPAPASALPPLVFYAFKNSGELWLNDNNNLSLIKASPNLFVMVGVPGKQTLAYSLIEYMADGLRSQVYLGDLQSLPTTDMLFDNFNTQSYAVKPLAISEANDQPAGIWYTMVPYGIGGDIIFEPRQTLNYINLADNNTTTYLDTTINPAGISDDQTWVAYTSSVGLGPLKLVNDFNFSSAVTFPLRADSDRGSGDAVFSPDNHYVAWKEASGSLADQPATFHETIRIGTVDGNIVTELPDTDLVAASGLSQIGWVVPIGWLDTQTLALEVRGSSWENANILRVKFDGSGLTNLVPGEFIGFLYP